MILGGLCSCSMDDVKSSAPEQCKYESREAWIIVVDDAEILDRQNLPSAKSPSRQMKTHDLHLQSIYLRISVGRIDNVVVSARTQSFETILYTTVDRS